MRQDSSSSFLGLIRTALVALLSAAVLSAGAFAPALAKSKPATKEKPQAKSKDNAEDAQDAGGAADKKSKKKKGDKNAKDKNAKDSSKPEQLGTFGDWGAYATSGKDKTCYALAAPKERAPKAKLKDTTANIFISTRPGEGVKNEVAITLGYATKDGGAASADIDGDDYELVTKGANAWVKNPAKEKEFVDALKGGSKLLVKAASAKGTTTTDTYSLKGLSDALTKVAAECR